MINVEDLLKPVGEDKPCGEDLTYHPSFQDLETSSRGKPETQFSPAEEPQWKAVRDSAIDVLNQSKHLTAGVILTASLLKIDGLEGFRDGLAVVRGLTERYWNDVYPRLDPDDNNDPTQRLNILNSLSSPAEPYKFTLHLKQIVLCDSQTMGRITLQQILSAQDATPDSGASKGNSVPDINQIQAAFRDAGPDAAQARLTLVTETIDHAQSLQNFIESAVGSGQGVNFDSLNQLLGEMKRALEPYTGNGAPSAETAESDSGAVAGGSGRAAAAPISGAIQTRGDVIRALTMICDYYRNNEPSSPVPLILQRAQRLVDKDFMAIVTDLTPDALSQLKVITGKTDGE